MSGVKNNDRRNHHQNYSNQRHVNNVNNQPSFLFVVTHTIFAKTMHFRYGMPSRPMTLRSSLQGKTRLHYPELPHTAYPRTTPRSRRRFLIGCSYDTLVQSQTDPRNKNQYTSYSVSLSPLSTSMSIGI